MVTFETIEKAAYAAVEQPFEKVIQDQSSWHNFWRELHSSKSSTKPLPTVDFRENLVIGVGVGNKSSGGYSVEIQEINIEGGVLLVKYLEEQPGANCFTTQALTQPYQLIKVKKFKLPVKFNRKTGVNNC
ncbi:protease complex subunit PrcB family protein [Lyngbya aestuarii]|uniref:protease complex subunit PrcB family protein n=1 Tax=Lyngbya aestuarii TaxID=118322 RepID=UPI00403DB777